MGCARTTHSEVQVIRRALSRLGRDLRLLTQTYQYQSQDQMPSMGSVSGDSCLMLLGLSCDPSTKHSPRPYMTGAIQPTRNPGTAHVPTASCLVGFGISTPQICKLNHYLSSWPPHRSRGCVKIRFTKKSQSSISVHARKGYEHAS